MSKAVKQDESIIQLKGLTIKKNTLYKVTGRPDLDAPKVLLELGISKYPDEGAINSVGMRFIEDSSGLGTGVYDTGFYTSSPCYIGIPADDVKKMVTSLRKNIVEPFELLRGSRDYTLTDHQNLEFWDKYTVNIWDGLVLDTSQPEQLFNLYMIVHSNHVEPSIVTGKQIGRAHV